MKHVIEYITESFQDRVIDLEKLPEDKKSIGKLKILIRNYTSIGDDAEKEDSYFDKLFGYIERQSPKRAQSLKLLRNDIHKVTSSTDERIKAVTKFLNSVFSYFKAEYNKENRKYGYVYDLAYINGAVIACAEYMSSWFGEDNKNVEKYMGKLLKAYEKITGKSFDKVFDKENEKYVKARAIYDEEMKTIADFKSKMKDFKYVYYAGTDHEAHGELHIYETSTLESFDEGFEKAKKACGSCSEYYYNYNPDTLIKGMLKSNGKMLQYGFCTGRYYFDEKYDDEHAVYMIGFINELPETIGDYSSYDKKMRYAGTLYTEKDKGHWSHYDSLWTVHTKK